MELQDRRPVGKPRQFPDAKTKRKELVLTPLAFKLWADPKSPIHQAGYSSVGEYLEMVFRGLVSVNPKPRP